MPTRISAPMPRNLSPPARLRALLAGDAFLTMPCCFDALSARLIEEAGFPLTFMSGFAVAAARFALPDTGLVTLTEMLEQGRSICEAVTIPVIADGDTGHGNPANVRRTVEQFGRAGCAAVMIEDQLSPKRCGHTGVREVVGRAEALARIRAAVDARDAGAGCLVLARTDARSALGLDEAIWRMRACADLGADILFLEAPRDESEMARFCREVPGVRMANMLEGGLTPVLPPARLAELGYRIAAYPLTLLACAVAAMHTALDDLAAGRLPARQAGFGELRRLVGFDTYDRLLAGYAEPSYCNDPDEPPPCPTAVISKT
jgi:2-methylisocitrate lyase-like PEP mutase family enzyme